MNDTNTSLHLAIFGGTGGTGRALVLAALEAGHHVTVLARTPSRVGATHARLEVVTGDVLESSDVRRVVRGKAAVLSCLGAPALARTDIREVGTQRIIEAMTAEGVRRLVSLSVLGIRDTTYALSPLLKYVIVPLYLRRAFADHARQEERIEASDLDWTIVRPPSLTDTPASGAYHYGERFDGRTTRLEVSREDVARFMLAQVSDATFLRRRPTIGAPSRTRRSRAVGDRTSLTTGT